LRISLLLLLCFILVGCSSIAAGPSVGLWRSPDTPTTGEGNLIPRYGVRVWGVNRTEDDAMGWEGSVDVASYTDGSGASTDVFRASVDYREDHSSGTILRFTALALSISRAAGQEETTTASIGLAVGPGGGAGKHTNPFGSILFGCELGYANGARDGLYWELSSTLEVLFEW
jgi:hypothetical protein